MSLRVPNLAVLLMALGIGVLAIYLENTFVAVVCFSIAAVYALVILRQRRHQRNKK